MGRIIQLDDLGEKITVQNQYGKVLGDIFIRADDFNILVRAEQVEEKIKKYIEEAERQTAAMDDSMESTKKVISDIDRKIKEEIDYLFDSPVSTEVFGNTHCLSTKNGKYFVENFLDAIIPEIEKIVSEESEASRSRMDKYLKEYTKDHLKKGGEHR